MARAFLREFGIEVWSFTAEVGGVAVDPANCTRPRDEADASPLRCPDPAAEQRMIARIDEARSAGDTVGGVFEVVVHGLPIGLGSYVHWDRRLDAALAAAVMSINIVKGVEFGLGFEQTRRFGSAVHDVIEGRGEDGRWVHRSNNAGGLTGGVTNGEPLVVRGAVKPISTLARPLPSADLVTGEAVDKAHYERSDISVVPAAGVVAEAMVMLTLASFVLEKFGGDTVGDIRASLNIEGVIAGARRLRRRRRCGAKPTRVVRRSAAGGDGCRGHAPRADRHGRGRLRRGRLRPAVDVVLVGLPGSGKSVIGEAACPPTMGRPSSTSTIRSSRRPADRSPTSSPRTARPPSARSSAAIADLGPADPEPEDPAGDRHRRRRGRRPAQPLGALPGSGDGLARWPSRGPRPTSPPLAARPAAGQRPRSDRSDPRPGTRRARFYAAAQVHQAGVAEVQGVVETIVEQLADGALAGAAAGTTLLRAETPIGRIVVGERSPVSAVATELTTSGARRAIVVSEPGAWAAAGESAGSRVRFEAALGWRGRAGFSFRRARPRNASKASCEIGGRRAAPRLRVERVEPLIAVGGGALGDAAGFLAATYLRACRSSSFHHPRRPDRLVDRRQDRR